LAIVWDWLRSVFGDASHRELVLAGVWCVAVLLNTHVPRLGEAIGGLFEHKP